jgi:predicted PurR-regulated permease PerM
MTGEMLTIVIMSIMANLAVIATVVPIVWRTRAKKNKHNIRLKKQPELSEGIKKRQIPIERFNKSQIQLSIEKIEKEQAKLSIIIDQVLESISKENNQKVMKKKNKKTIIRKTISRQKRKTV